MSGKLLRPKTVARRYNVHKDTVLDWLRIGQLESVQHDGKWFVSEDALNSYWGDGMPLRESDISRGVLKDRWQWLSDAFFRLVAEDTRTLHTIVKELTAIKCAFDSNSIRPNVQSEAVESLAQGLIIRLEQIIDDQSR